MISDVGVYRISEVNGCRVNWQIYHISLRREDKDSMVKEIAYKPFSEESMILGRLFVGRQFRYPFGYIFAFGIVGLV